MLWDMNAYQFRFEFDLADRLRKSLRVSGVSVEAMAQALGVSRNTVGNWINGRTKPCDEQLTIWAAITDSPKTWLESGEPPAIDIDGGSKVKELCTAA